MQAFDGLPGWAAIEQRDSQASASDDSVWTDLPDRFCLPGVFLMKSLWWGNSGAVFFIVGNEQAQILCLSWFRLLYQGFWIRVIWAVSMRLFRFASLKKLRWAYESVSLVFKMDNKIKLSQALLATFCKGWSLHSSAAN